ncbi:MAG: hypothetical protein CM15mP103_09190 [Gammaproteobacteria bacterium]|nr:MAG: hypothetical protein CM15mP103_09190 [Gammaproteobacteria bacterium]
MATILDKVFCTDDPKHPGVAAFTAQGRTVISGPIEVLNYSYFEEDFPDTFRTAMAIRSEIAERGWERVVAFQTRNPMHRAHEELAACQWKISRRRRTDSHATGQAETGRYPRRCARRLDPQDGRTVLPPNTVMVTG